MFGDRFRVNELPFATEWSPLASSSGNAVSGTKDTSIERGRRQRFRAVQIGDITINRLGYGAMRLRAPASGARHRTAALRWRRCVGFRGSASISSTTADSYGPDVSEQLIHERCIL